MPVIETRLDSRDAIFARNRDALAALVADLKARVAEIEQGGGEAARTRHAGRGKLLPRERVRALLDPGTPFLELSQLAAYGMYDPEEKRAWIGRVAYDIDREAELIRGAGLPRILADRLFLGV